MERPRRSKMPNRKYLDDGSTTPKKQKLDIEAAADNILRAAWDTGADSDPELDTISVAGPPAPVPAPAPKSKRGVVNSVPKSPPKTTPSLSISMSTQPSLAEPDIEPGGEGGGDDDDDDDENNNNNDAIDLNDDTAVVMPTPKESHKKQQELHGRAYALGLSKPEDRCIHFRRGELNGGHGPALKFDTESAKKRDQSPSMDQLSILDPFGDVVQLKSLEEWKGLDGDDRRRFINSRRKAQRAWWSMKEKYTRTKK